LFCVTSDMAEWRHPLVRHTLLKRCVEFIITPCCPTTYSHSRRHRNISLNSLRRDGNNCEPPDPANTVTDRLNKLLKDSGEGYVLHLCPKKTYLIQAPIIFAHPNQEISTLGYPTGHDRAILSVSGPVSDGKGHTTAVDGTCHTCSGISLRNIQVCARLDPYLPF